MHICAPWESKNSSIKFSLNFEVKTKKQKQLTEYLQLFNVIYRYLT
jgi:hypothetical protein